MPKIIAVSGKKQSGKDSLCSYIKSLYSTLGNDKVNIFQSDEGKVTFLENGVPYEPDNFMLYRMEECAVFSFSDALKKFCEDTLQIDRECLYGTDEQKNRLTKFSWDKMPFFVAWSNSPHRKIFYRNIEENFNIEALDSTVKNVNTEQIMLSFMQNNQSPVFEGQRTGMMTAREVMQVLGTDVIRKMFSDDIWVKRTMKDINESKKKIVLIADLRFKTELKSIFDNEGYVIRLQRNLFPSDSHSSENDLTSLDFSGYGRTLIVKEGVTISEKNAIVKEWLLANNVLTS